MQAEIFHRPMRRERIGWCLYGWANAPFSTSVLVVFLGPYTTAIAESASSGGRLSVAGFQIPASTLFPYLVSFSFFCRFVILPFLGALADVRQWNKAMLGWSAYIGALSTCSLYSFGSGRIAIYAVLVWLAIVTFNISTVFYDSLLPRVAPPELRETVSCCGGALGYLSGGIVLAAHLLLLQYAAPLHLTADQAIRLTFLSSGIWWGVFTIAPLATIRGSDGSRPRPRGAADRRNPLVRIRRQLSSWPQATRLILAMALCDDAIQTIMVIAVLFGELQLKLSMTTLTAAILLVQFIGVLGPFIFGMAARFISAKWCILCAAGCITGILVFACGLASSARDFFIMAAGFGVAIGGTEALSRALIADLTPRGCEGEFFSLRQTIVCATGWMGPLSFGFAYQLCGSYKIAVLTPIIFLALAGCILATVDIFKGKEQTTARRSSLLEQPLRVAE
jgi:UMF1 family MFS transporter